MKKLLYVEKFWSGKQMATLAFRKLLANFSSTKDNQVGLATVYH